MNDEYALRLLRRMVEIPSVSGTEAEVGAFLMKEMELMGFRSFIDGAGNVVGEIGSGSGPLIMLLGHMDTVPGLVPVRQEGNLLYGRGAVDAKGPLATAICAARKASETGCRLVVIGAVEEETPGSRGAHYLLDRYSPDVVFIGEPSGWDNVVLGYKGRVGILFEASRPSSHPAGPGDKAVEVAVTFWNRFSQYLTSVNTKSSQFHSATATLVRLEGTAEQARLAISCRTPPDFDMEALQQMVRDLAGSDLVQFDEVTPAALYDRSVPPARALLSSIRHYGGKPGLKVKTGTSDMNIVSKRWRAPMVAYGPGDSSLDHTPDEHIDLDEYLKAIQVLAHALQTLGSELVEAAAAKRAQEQAYTSDEEEELTKRLQALGYLD